MHYVTWLRGLVAFARRNCNIRSFCNVLCFRCYLLRRIYQLAISLPLSTYLGRCFWVALIAFPSIAFSEDIPVIGGQLHNSLLPASITGTLFVFTLSGLKYIEKLYPLHFLYFVFMYYLWQARGSCSLSFSAYPRSWSSCPP